MQTAARRRLQVLLRTVGTHHHTLRPATATLARWCSTQAPRADGIPRYATIQPEDVEGSVGKMLEACEAELAKAEAVNVEDATWESVMGPLDAIDVAVSSTWGAVSHLMSVRNTDELRRAHEAALPGVVKFGLRVKQSKKILALLEAMKASPGYAGYSSGQKRVIEQHIRSAKLAGLLLPADAQARFNEITEALSQLSSNYRNNVLDAVRRGEKVLYNPKQVKGMPLHVLEAAHDAMVERHPNIPSSVEKGPWCFSLDLYVMFMQYCDDRSLREEMYRLNATKASDGAIDNTPLILRILTLRREKAALLGYAHHADVSLASKMAPSVDGVLELIEKMRAASMDKAKEEVAWMAALAGHEIRPWDVQFYIEKIRNKALNLSPDLVNYFPLERVLEGLFGVVERLFNVTIARVEVDDELSWDADVRMYEVREKGASAAMAKFFLDPYVRPQNKKGGAWMSGAVTRRRVDADTVVRPVAHIVCNASKPVGKKPALLTSQDAVTLFHECGHALQHMLTAVDTLGCSGIEGVEWDAVELPSQFMENWFYLEPNLRAMARHWETDEPLADEAVKGLMALRPFMAGVHTLRQMSLATIDMELHSRYTPPAGAQVDALHLYKFYQETMARFTVVEPIPEERLLCAFSHIFAGGYSAGYYSYIWAEVLSADAFAAFEEAGLDDPAKVAEVGQRFRDTVLGLGGSVHPGDVFRAFRGRDPDPEALLRHNGLGDHPRVNLLKAM